MKAGYLSGYFEGVAVKHLSAVETDPAKSNQHEFNGVQPLKAMFGLEKQTLNADFIYIDDENDIVERAEGFLTWYDARENHDTRTEHRFYFPTTSVSELASEGDFLLIGKKPDNTVLAVVAKAGSISENQLKWLFGISEVGEKFLAGICEDTSLSLVHKIILEQIGIELDDREDDLLDTMLARFGDTFPTTRIFSLFARSTIRDISALDDPDMAVIAWLDQEEKLFRTLERHIVSKRLETGFREDVDSFIQFSLSVHNRRKSRAGHALENHIEKVFIDHGVRYDRGKVTENRSRPDFVFPGIAEYRNECFSADCLSMLGVKTTCKDRWRQVLVEADRIDRKHLFTLQPGITENQTNEMRSNNLQLVVPEELKPTFTSVQQGWLMNLQEFIEMVSRRSAG